jgi:hypothetical protein
MLALNMRETIKWTEWRREGWDQSADIDMQIVVICIQRSYSPSETYNIFQTFDMAV